MPDPVDIPLDSPLEPIVARFGKPLAFPFAEQFLHTDKLPYNMQLQGVLHRVWFRPRFLAPLFWFLGKCRILVPASTTEAPTVLEVIPSRDGRGQPVHTWKRTIDLRGRRYVFPTSIIYDPKLKCVVDLVGPANCLYMVWRAEFHPDNSFTLDSTANALRIGKLKIWFPRWVWKFQLGTVTFVQRADTVEPATVHIDLLLTHPLFGRIFGYEGTFRTVRMPRTSAIATPAKAPSENSA